MRGGLTTVVVGAMVALAVAGCGSTPKPTQAQQNAEHAAAARRITCREVANSTARTDAVAEQVYLEIAVPRYNPRFLIREADADVNEACAQAKPDDPAYHAAIILAGTRLALPLKQLEQLVK